jgi:hypothetical protein
MRNSKMLKGITTMVAAVCMMMLMTATVFAASKDLIKDGAFAGTGFINSGSVVDGTIQGPGNWTQLNLGDAAIDGAYLHIIIKATGDTTAAKIDVSDKLHFNLVNDLGITLTEDYQDVVLKVGDAGIDMLSWLNFSMLGEDQLYTIKDIFLSDDAASTIAAAAPAEEEAPAAEAPAEDLPDTGYSMTLTIIAVVGIIASAVVLVGQRKFKRA